MGHIQVDLTQGLHLLEYLAGRPGEYRRALVHHHDAVSQSSLLHEVGDPDHGDALFLVQPLDSFEHFLAAGRIEHGGGFVGDDDAGLHGENARDGDALLLSAREHVRGSIGLFGHAHGRKRIVDAPHHLIVGDTQIFHTEGNVLADNGGNDLIVGVLEDHAGLLADIPQVILVRRVKATDRHLALRGQIESVEQLRHGGFARAIMAQNSQEFSLLHVQGDVGKGRLCGLFIGEGYVLHGNDRFVHEIAPYNEGIINHLVL